MFLISIYLAFIILVYSCLSWICLPCICLSCTCLPCIKLSCISLVFTFLALSFFYVSFMILSYLHLSSWYLPGIYFLLHLSSFVSTSSIYHIYLFLSISLLSSCVYLSLSTYLPHTLLTYIFLVSSLWFSYPQSLTPSPYSFFLHPPFPSLSLPIFTLSPLLLIPRFWKPSPSPHFPLLSFLFPLLLILSFTSLPLPLFPPLPHSSFFLLSSLSPPSSFPMDLN